MIRTLLTTSIFRHGGAVLFDQGFLSIATFATGIFIARATSKEEYGAYVLTWSLLLILASVHRAIVQLPLTVYLPRMDEKEKNQYQGSALIFTLCVAALFIILVAIVLSIQPRSEINNNVAWSEVGILIIILATPYLLREYIRNALFARLSFTASITANFIATTAQLSSIALLYYTNRLDLISALWTIIGSSALAAGLMLFHHHHHIEITKSRIVSDFNKGRKMAKWILLNVLGMMGASQAYPWILLIMLDTTAVAVFGAAMAVASVISPILRAANAYILPRMSHGYKDGNSDNLKRMLRKSIIALLIPYSIWTLLGSLFADKLLTLFYTDEYSGFGLVVILLLVKTMIESVSTPLTSVLQTLEKPEITTYALGIGSVITLALTPIAISQHGIVGAAAVAVVSATIVATYKYIMFTRLSSAPI